MNGHVVTRLASVSIDTCAACVIMNARGIAMAMGMDLSQDAWLPLSAEEYAALLTKLIRVRFAMETHRRNRPLVDVLTALEDDGIAIFMNFLTSEDDRKALIRVRSLWTNSMDQVFPAPSRDPAVAVFDRVKLMQDFPAPERSWLHWS